MTAEATFFNQVKGYNLPIPNFYFANDGSNGKPQCVIMQDYSNIATGVMFYEHVTNEMCLNFSKILAEFQAKVLELPFKLKESKFTEQAFGMFNVFMDKYIPDKFLELDSSKYHFISCRSIIVKIGTITKFFSRTRWFTRPNKSHPNFGVY